MFVLCPAGANAILEKRSRKRGAVVSVGSSHIEIIFTLLAKSLTVQIQFSEIQDGKTSLEGLFLWLHYWHRSLDWGLDLSFNGVHVGLHEKLEQFFGRRR